MGRIIVFLFGLAAGFYVCKKFFSGSKTAVTDKKTMSDVTDKIKKVVSKPSSVTEEVKNDQPLKFEDFDVEI